MLDHLLAGIMQVSPARPGCDNSRSLFLSRHDGLGGRRVIGNQAEWAATRRDDVVLLNRHATALHILVDPARLGCRHG